MALTDTKVRAAKPEANDYSLVDGDGMSLLIKPNGSKYWRFRFRFGGKQHLMAFGVYPETSLADARQKREAARKLVAAGIDPREHKRTEKEELAKEVITFEVVAREWHASNKKWSEAHSARVLQSLEDKLFGAIGKRAISELKTPDLLAPIKAVEIAGRLEVASRLQQRTTAIMRYAVQSGLIDYNPAQEMAGAVATGKRKHRAALELNRVSELLHRIDYYSGRPLTRLAVELTLLVFIRSSELRFARWSEVDFETAMWTIPGEREPLEGVKHSHRGSKMRTPHLVPLSRQALAILEKIKSMSGNRELIFIGDHDPRKPKDKKEEFLSNILARLNDLFITDNLSDKDMINYAFTVRDKLSENQAVMTQIANNTREQAMLGDFPKAIDDAVMDSNDAQHEMMMQYLSNPELAKGFARVVFDMLKGG